jgi:serine protease
MNLSHRDASRAALVNFEGNIKSPFIFSNLQQSRFEKDLASKNTISYRKYKTLQHIKSLNQNQDVEYAEPNYIYHPLVVPNDQFYSLQWHYPAINLPLAWDITTGSRAGNNVIVAVVDTGIYLAHPEFSGQLVNGFDFISDLASAADGDGIDANPDDPGDGAQIGSSSWHGTHVAGTIAALSNNNSGVTGIAWDAKIMPIRALGVRGGTGYDIIQSIRFAAGLDNDSNTVPVQKADVINLSLGGSGYSLSAQNSYNEVRSEGVIVVAAAGNGNTSQLSYPASYDGVVSVSATDFVNNRAPYSNFGAQIDIAAPGGNKGVDLNNDGYGDGVLSTLVDDSSGTRNPSLFFYNGTSMASPHVAGVFALMRAVHPTLSPDDIDSLLSAGSITTDIGNVGRDDLYGHGLIDALKAVQSAQMLANGGTLPSQPALIVASPNQLTLGLGNSSIVTLSNQGEAATSVTTFSSNASWLIASAINVGSNGLGDYQVLVDRTGLNVGFYVGTITFDLATGSSLNIQVSMLVGAPNDVGDVGRIYTLLIDNYGNPIDAVLAIDQGNGVFDYSFPNVSPGFYRVVAGSDIDNDLVICQLAESCGGYPTINELITVEAINTDINELDFVIDILSNFGTSSLSFEANSITNGFHRQFIKSKQVNLPK